MSDPATDLALVPLAAFDIRADGSAVVAPDTGPRAPDGFAYRSEEHTSELQSRI